MQGLFSQKNMLLCDMQGNKYGLLVKKIKKIPKITYIRPAGRVLTFDKHHTSSAGCYVFERILIELRFNMIENLCLGFISLYLWLCYVFKSV